MDSLNSLLLFPGVKLVESIHMVTQATVTRPRTWRERLWSFPWHPWDSVVTETVNIPNPNFFHDTKNNVIYAHPQTMLELKQYLLSLK